MTDTQLWWLTLEIAVLAAIVSGAGYVSARYLARKFDREYGRASSPGE